MGYYFDDSVSMNAYEGTNPKAILTGLANRFIGQNPKHDLCYRAYTNKGITRVDDYRYRVDFNTIFPDAQDNECVWAFTKFFDRRGAVYGFDVNCFGPMVMYLNGEVIYKSDIFKERYSETSVHVDLHCQDGWNDLRIKFTKTKAGFGGHFGTWIGKWDFYSFMPTKERDGQEGFVFTQPMPFNYEPRFEPGMSEADFEGKLYPDITWSEEELEKPQLERLFGAGRIGYAMGWTKGVCDKIGKNTYSFDLNTDCESIVYIDEQEVYKGRGGSFEAELGFGKHDIMVRCKSENNWGFELTCDDIRFENAAKVKGTDEVWMYIGPFDYTFEFPFDKAVSMHRVIGIPRRYWVIDVPDTTVRPYNSNGLYGKWNYPLGVTLYGLLHTALTLESEEMKQYIKDHVQLTVETFDYALWDKEQYGGATSIHNLLTSIDSLDDCGSFASVMLEADKFLYIHGVEKVADYVGEYISYRQSRLDDGSFYRRAQLHSFHNMTMWADDLYMSVPFLSRYYKFTGDTKYVDDAAKQFFGFKEKLYMPEKQIMSHVYDFKYETKTGVPWGRGNGWVVFSMTELLAVLPRDHKLRDDLIEFLNTLCEGYLKLQDEDGMWHQVLTDHESYPETSCTSMFIYAFCRGVRYGWLKEPEKYVAAAYKAWEALSKISVDNQGNVFGVCRGSEFSFMADYYKYELGWNLNDTHGTGIVMLAGVEIIKLEEFLNK